MHESYGSGISTVGFVSLSMSLSLSMSVSLSLSYGSGISTVGCVVSNRLVSTSHSINPEFVPPSQGAGGDRVFPLNFAVTMNMPDPNNIGVSGAIKARIYSEGLSGDSWGLSVFNFGAGPGGYAEYVIPVEVRVVFVAHRAGQIGSSDSRVLDWLQHRGISSYTMEMAELVRNCSSAVYCCSSVLLQLCTAAALSVSIILFCCHSTDSVLFKHSLDYEWRQLRVLWTRRSW